MKALMLVWALIVPWQPARANVQVLRRAQSLFNGELMVVDQDGKRFLLAKARKTLMLHSLMDLSEPNRVLEEVAQVISVATALRPQPNSVFNMGLGGGMLPRFHLARYPESHVDSAEIDPSVLDLARNYFQVAGPRHELLFGDALAVLNTEAKKFDVIWVDVGTPKAGPTEFIPGEFVDAIRNHLSAGGLMIANLGTRKNWDEFKFAVAGYKRGYAHGIRIEVPESVASKALKELEPELNPGKPAPVEAAMGHVLAVSDDPGLTCQSFWKTYREWVAKKLVSIDWKESPEKACQDLK